MKSTIGLFFFLFTVTVNLPGQGIYKSWQDYQKKHFADSAKSKIRLHYLLSGKYVDVISGGKKYRFSKDSIFGYRDKDHKDYRFYKSYDKGYRILESGAITIYTANVEVTSSTGKNAGLVPAYFFSTSIYSEIIPLTLLNLKKAYPGNMKFRDMLDSEFGNGQPLTTYSAKDNMYEINVLLNKSNIDKAI